MAEICFVNCLVYYSAGWPQRGERCDREEGSEEERSRDEVERIPALVSCRHRQCKCFCK